MSTDPTYWDVVTAASRVSSADSEEQGDDAFGCAQRVLQLLGCDLDRGSECTLLQEAQYIHLNTKEQQITPHEKTTAKRLIMRMSECDPRVLLEETIESHGQYCGLREIVHASLDDHEKLRSILSVVLFYPCYLLKFDCKTAAVDHMLRNHDHRYRDTLREVTGYVHDLALDKTLKRGQALRDAATWAEALFRAHGFDKTVDNKSMRRRRGTRRRHGHKKKGGGAAPAEAEGTAPAEAEGAAPAAFWSDSGPYAIASSPVYMPTARWNALGMPPN